MPTPDDCAPLGPGRSWLFSLAFWLCLFAAAGLYGAVALSPKLLTYFELSREHNSNQWRLVSLERQVAHLQRIIDAEKNDPAFVREQARTELEVAGPEEQRIEVESHLHLKIGTGSPDLATPPGTRAWYEPLLAFLAYSRSTSNLFLAAAAGLVLYAFTLLRDSDCGLQRPEAREDRAA